MDKNNKEINNNNDEFNKGMIENSTISRHFRYLVVFSILSAIVFIFIIIANSVSQQISWIFTISLASFMLFVFLSYVIYNLIKKQVIKNKRKRNE